MNARTLLRRNLGHHWRVNLAILMGVAVGTAVLTGALLVGDSVRGSLRDLTLDRLGRVDHALVSDRFFRREVAARLEKIPQFQRTFQHVSPAVFLRGTAMSAGTRRRANQVHVWGVDEGFWKLGSAPADSQPEGREATLNESLARELAVSAGDSVLVWVEKPSAVPREIVLGRRTGTVRTQRLKVKSVLPDRGLGRFGFEAHQQLPRNVFVPIDTLQRGVEQPARVNALLVAGKDDAVSRTPDASRQLQAMLRQVIDLEDLGLSLKRNPTPGTLSLESREMVLGPSLAGAAMEAATRLKLETAPIFTYLANTLASGERSIPYSTLSGLDPSLGSPFGPLRLIDGTPAPSLAEDEILLNEWAVEDLRARRGDAIVVTYYEVGSRGELIDKTARFRLKGTVRLWGPAADSTLTPEFPGIHDADSMMDWDPPFPVDLRRVRQRDEDYWDRYRATPKGFVSLPTAKKLWTSRYGSLTSIRLGAAPGTSLAATAEKFREHLLERFGPEQTGLLFRPVKFQGLAGTKGSTDFGMLFVGFAIFLIISAALWVALLVRLGIERRAKEIGILMATGKPLRFLRRLFLVEGTLLAVLGGVAGLIGALGYGWFMVYGLRTWWREAVGSPFIELHVTGMSLLAGFLGSLTVIFFSIGLAVRYLGKSTPKTLLAGSSSPAPEKLRSRRRSNRPLLTGGIALALALGLIAISLGTGKVPILITFYVSGVSLLVAALAFFTAALVGERDGNVRGSGLAAIARLGMRNASRVPGRSVLTAGLVASASFVIVTVSLNRQDLSTDFPIKDSGNGGFSLVAESDLPLHHDLDSQEGRRELGIPSSAGATLKEAEIVPFRLRPGEDVSCLNLYRPTQPRLLGATSAMIRRGGFEFQSSLAETPEENANPWLLLDREFEEGVVPAVGDANTVVWILHLGLGKDLTISDESGNPVRLRIVGLLKRSVFQSELLISEEHFLRLFGRRSGFQFFMIEVAGANSMRVARALEKNLGEFGLDVTSTADRLAGYLVVENTYLSTFQALGGLGLMLGTLGLATLILRNVVERRSELALLVSLGFRRVTIGWLLLAENGFLLLFGLAAGTVSALLSVAPHLATSGSTLPWLSVGFTLLLICGVGLAAGAAAAATVLRTPLLSALRSE